MTTHKKKRNALIQKLDGLLRRLRLPQYLHHYGPKKYCLKDHLIALLYKQKWKESYREVCEDLEAFGFNVPTYSALCKMMKRMPLTLWRALFRATVMFEHTTVAAVDSTGMAKAMPSWHYIQRIDRKALVARPLKLSIMVDTKRKKILSFRLRAKPAHDVKDFPYLLRHSLANVKTVVADKGYDSEALHEQCFQRGVKSMIPCRSSSRKGFYRKKSVKRFRTRTYNRRQIVECVFSSLKRRYGASLRSRSWQMQNKEMHARLVVYNLFCLLDFFNRAQCSENLFKDHTNNRATPRATTNFVDFYGRRHTQGRKGPTQRGNKEARRGIQREHTASQESPCPA